MNTSRHESVAQHYENYPYPSYPWFFWGRWRDLEKLDLSRWKIEGKVRSAWLCGAGTVQPLLFGRRNPNVKFLATDLSSRSLLYARIRCFAFGAWNVEFLKEDLSFSTRENEFCAIDAFGVLHHTENPRRSLELLVRALRKGGVLRIMLYSDTARAPFEKLREELLKEKPTWTDDELRQEIRSRGLSLTGELSNRSGRADALIHPLVKCFSESEVLDLLRDLSLEVLSQTKDGNHILYLRKTS